MMKKFLCKLIFYLLVSLVSVQAQNEFSSQFDYANTLFKTGNYFDAITEYKRLIFFDSTKTYYYRSYFQIGKCYKAGAKFDDAIKYFSISELNASDESERFYSKIEIIRCNILRGTTSRAHQLLNEMELKFTGSEIKDSINYWHGWAYMFEDDWKNAALSFAKINPDHELKLICDRVEKEKVSVTFATVISYILPGAGQIYTGNFLSGLLSLGWNVLSAYLTINAFNANRIFDGIAILTLIWQRFYRGNIQNSIEFAVNKNIDIANGALINLQKQFRGAKP
jgi:tetratricopeptide (TPR) repeat protein